MARPGNHYVNYLLAWMEVKPELSEFVMGPGQKFLTRVESGQPFMVWV